MQLGLFGFDGRDTLQGVYLSTSRSSTNATPSRVRKNLRSGRIACLPSLRQRSLAKLKRVREAVVVVESARFLFLFFLSRQGVWFRRSSFLRSIPVGCGLSPLLFDGFRSVLVMIKRSSAEVGEIIYSADARHRHCQGVTTASHSQAYVLEVTQIARRSLEWT